MYILRCIGCVAFSVAQAIMVFGQGNPTGLKPNIILIIGDDISYDDIGCYGNSKVKTPHIDSLSSQGIRFDNMYVTSSSCSPSRTSLLTGRYPHNTGAAELHEPLPAHLTFFPELLQQAGYYTALAGKWHEGPETARAYDRMEVGRKNGEGGEERWMDVLDTAYASGRPFFLWLASVDAHRPWSADSQFNVLHDPEREVEIPPTLLGDGETRKDLASYYNEIGRLDSYVGKIVHSLRKKKILDHTVIIFMADNGRPFPGSKTRLQDRGLKVPFIVYWPQRIGQTAVTEALCSGVDVGPTILDMASVMPSPDMQGKSFLSVLKNPSLSFRNHVFSEHNWHDFEAYERAVRTKDYLYVYNGRPQFDNGGSMDVRESPSYGVLEKQLSSGKLSELQREPFTKPRPQEEFYVMSSDSLQIRNEINNASYKRQIRQLRRVLRRWQRETGDTEPKVLTHPVAKPGGGFSKVKGEMPGASRDATHNNNKGPF
ncbi:MAG: heparan N-sulfatase [Parapedobacter sp.]|nr:MAG: heparan N-sulfatase [Parapedobacter sp.]